MVSPVNGWCWNFYSELIKVCNFFLQSLVQNLARYEKKLNKNIFIFIYWMQFFNSPVRCGTLLLFLSPILLKKRGSKSPN